MWRSIKTQKFGTWLERQYLEWQYKLGRTRSRAEFARFLGISPALLSHYFSNLRKPSRKNIIKIAERLNPEIYDFFGLLRPDADFQFLASHWANLSAREKKEILDIVRKKQKQS